jgi:hypothetical protein
MSSLLKANSISAATGSTVTIPSGTTLDIASGATIDATGATATGFGVSNDFVNVALSADQAMTKNVITKVQYDTEVYDPNGWWDSTTNYRFQPDEAGYYLVIAHLGWNNAGTQYDIVDGYVYKNGSEFMHGETLYRASMVGDITISCISQMNGSSDYLEIYARHGTNDNPPLDATGFNASTATNNMASFVRLT